MTTHLYNKQDNEQLNKTVEAKQSEMLGSIQFSEGGVNAVEMGSQLSPQFQVSPEMIKAAQAQLADGGGAVVLNQNGQSQMFSGLGEMFKNRAENTTTAKQIYFTVGKGKVSFNIDNSIFEPTPITRLAGKQFEKRYTEQLEGYIFNTNDELDPDKLFALIYLVSFIKNNQYPVKVVTGKHRIQQVKITNVINEYFNKNYSILMSIYSMFNGTPSGVNPQ